MHALSSCFFLQVAPPPSQQEQSFSDMAAGGTALGLDLFCSEEIQEHPFYCPVKEDYFYGLGLQGEQSCTNIVAILTLLQISMQVLVIPERRG